VKYLASQFYRHVSCIDEFGNGTQRTMPELEGTVTGFPSVPLPRLRVLGSVTLALMVAQGYAEY
jgi:hypothetical protein